MENLCQVIKSRVCPQKEQNHRSRKSFSEEQCLTDSILGWWIITVAEVSFKCHYWLSIELSRVFAVCAHSLMVVVAHDAICAVLMTCLI